MVTMLIASLTMLIFIMCCAIVGILMYRLGLNGRITRMVEDAEQESKSNSRIAKEPTSIPGQEFNPFTNDYQPRYTTSLDDEDEEGELDGLYIDDEELDEVDYESDPVVPGHKSKVVMTGGG